MQGDTIYKYTLELKDQQYLTLPAGREFLSVQMQRGKICLWYRVPYAPKGAEQASFVIVGTGHVVPAGKLKFLGTVQQPEYESVWHVFAAN